MGNKGENWDEIHTNIYIFFQLLSKLRYILNIQLWNEKKKQRKKTFFSII